MDMRAFLRRSSPDWSGLWPTVVSHMRIAGRRQPRSVSCHCLQFILLGQLRFYSARGVDQVLGPQHLFLIEPDIPYFYHNTEDQPAEINTLNLIGPLAEPFTRSLGFRPDRLFFKARQPERVAQLFTELLQLARSRDPASDHLVVSLLHQLPPACQQASRADDNSQSLVERVLQHAQTHLELGENIEQLAARFKVSRYTLFNKFREAFGEGPAATLISLRLSRAKLLLENTDLKASEISSLCGYQSVEHFTRQFRAKVGQNPTDWRHAPERLHRRRWKADTSHSSEDRGSSATGG